MTERPIIFSGPMVRALLDGRRTQTRRVLKPQPDDADAVLYDPFTSAEMGYEGFCFSRRNAPAQTIRFPYATGDRLWVREAHYLTNKHAYRLSVGVEQRINPSDDYEACVFKEGFDRSTSGLRSRPSIHMPRWASRLTLTVTDVRVQRLQDISEADAVAEGVTPYNDPPEIAETPAADAFMDLWNSLHGPDAWDQNPWVAAYTFTVQHGNIDEVANASN